MIKNLSVVGLDDIPEAHDVPLDNLINVFKTITQMEAICTKMNGIGLSATQVGIPWKLFVIRKQDCYEYYLNCQYEGSGDFQLSVEGCLSLLSKNGLPRRFEVQRYKKIKFIGKQLKVDMKLGIILEDINVVVEDLHAVVIQHE